MTDQSAVTPATEAATTAAPSGIVPDIHWDELKNLDAHTFAAQFTDLESGLMQMAITWGTRLIAAILILIVGWMIGNWINNRFAKLPRLDNTLKNFLGGFFKYTVVAVAAITVIGLFGIPMASLLAVLGAAGLAIGLALQGTLANVASGVMLLILRPFNVGDYITWGGQGGTVKSLGLFGTEFAMADNVYVFAPNSKIWGTEIANYSRNMLRRQDIQARISYGDDINEAFEVIYGILNADSRVLKEPDDKKPQVMVDQLADFSINLIVRFWSTNADYWNLRWDLTKIIQERLAHAGITIPYPTRTVEVVDSTLNGADPGTKKKIASGAA